MKLQIKTKEEAILLAIGIILIFVKIEIENKLVIKLLSISIKKHKEKILWLTEASLITIISLIFTSNNTRLYCLNTFVIIATSIFIYKRFFKTTLEKSILAVEINFVITIIIMLITNLIIAKSKYIIFTITITLDTLIKIILYKIIEQKSIKLEIPDLLKWKEKLMILAQEFTSIIIGTILAVYLIENTNNIIQPLYIQLITVISIYLAISLYGIINIFRIDKRNKIIEDLEEINKRLESNYDDVRSFKHDFNNIMQGIGGYIAINDMDGLKKMYKSILNDCEQINNNQLINKETINNPAIYNLINSKIRLAKQNDVNLKINVYIDLNTLNISSYDLCRMLGILIDNAIESAKMCEDKTIYIKFIKDKLNNRNLVIVENPYKNYLVDIKKIYEKGITSKKDRAIHGLGLWKVKQILRKNKNIQIYTSRDKLFKQQLEIY